MVIEDFLTDEDISLMKRECAEIVSAMSPNEHRTIFSTKDNYQPVSEQGNSLSLEFHTFIFSTSVQELGVILDQELTSDPGPTHLFSQQ